MRCDKCRCCTEADQHHLTPSTRALAMPGECQVMARRQQPDSIRASILLTFLGRKMDARLETRSIASTSASPERFRPAGSSGSVAPPRSRPRWRRDFAPRSRRRTPNIWQRNTEPRCTRRDGEYRNARLLRPDKPGLCKRSRPMPNVNASFKPLDRPQGFQCGFQSGTCI